MYFKHSSIQGLIISIEDIMPETGTVAGLKPLFDSFKQINLPHILISRSSSNGPNHYVQKFAHAGVHLHSDQILTPVIVTVNQLRDWFLPGMTVFAVGKKGLHQALTQAWYRVATPSSENIGNIDFICIDPQVNIDKQTACMIKRLKEKGAPVITIDAVSCLSHNLDSISKIEAVRESISSNLSPPPLFGHALNWLGCARESTAVLGSHTGTILKNAKEAGFKQIISLSDIDLNRQSIGFGRPELENQIFNLRQHSLTEIKKSVFYTLN